MPMVDSRPVTMFGGLVFAATLLFVKASGIVNSRYSVVSVGIQLDPDSTVLALTSSSKLKCALLCLSLDSCYIFAYIKHSAMNCLLTDDNSPSYLSNSYSVVYRRDGVNTQGTTETSHTSPSTVPPVTTTTETYAETSTTEAIYTTFGDVGGTTVMSATCDDVTASGSVQSCSGTIRNVKAAMRLNSNKAAVFLNDGTYLVCGTVDDINIQHCTPCPSNVLAGDANRDPDNIFSTGPDAALEYNHPTASQSKYFLIKGGTVYCYQHQSSSPYFTLCTTGWQSMSLQNRFGAGIPDSPDAAMGSWGQWTFYFIKNGLVYTSNGDSTSGTLQGPPVPVHDVFPSFPCSSTAIMEGMNKPEKLFFESHKHFFRNGGDTLYLKGQVCK